MRIHHATKAKAEKNDIILTAVEQSDGFTAQAHWMERNFVIRHPDPKQALAACMLHKQFVADWPNLAIDCADGVIMITDKGDEPVTIYEGDTVPELADVLDACDDFDIDPALGFDEDYGIRPVVPVRYRREYAERGNPNHCGDWLAKKLDGAFDTDLGFDHALFAEFLELNGVDMTGKWASLPETGQRGWQGRYRMNGRQKLEVIVARVGYFLIKIDDEVRQYDAPKAYLETLAEKHPKVQPEWK